MEWVKKEPKIKGSGDLLAQLGLINGIASDSLDEFMLPTKKSLNSPYLLGNIEIARDKTIEAINKKSRICISGDVDVDGVTSLTIVYQYLKAWTDNIYYVYHQRSKGHNIEPQLEMIDGQTSLLIILDSSSNDVKSCKTLRERGIDIIIIDHHQIKELNEYALIVNPQADASPNKELSTSALCYKFIQTLEPLLPETNISRRYDYYIDLAGVGLYADRMCMLTPENRYFVSEALYNIQNPGLKAILEIVGKTSGITSTDIAFTIAPFINSAARLDLIELAIELLNSSDNKRCLKLAGDIKGLNETRKDIQAKHIKSLQEQINPSNSVHILVGDNTVSRGFTGVVAAEIQGQTHRPVIYLNKTDEILSGSYRSSFDMMTLLENLPIKKDEIHVGGHLQAGGCGFPSNKLETVQYFLNKNVELFEIKYYYDIELETNMFFDHFQDILDFNRICGKNFDQSVFLFKRVYVCFKHLMGKNKDHMKIRCRLKGSQNLIDILKFKINSNYSSISQGSYIDVLGTVSLNEWGGKTTKQILMLDYKYSMES